MNLNNKKYFILIILYVSISSFAQAYSEQDKSSNREKQYIQEALSYIENIGPIELRNKILKAENPIQILIIDPSKAFTKENVEWNYKVLQQIFGDSKTQKADKVVIDILDNAYKALISRNEAKSLEDRPDNFDLKDLSQNDIYNFSEKYAKYIHELTFTINDDYASILMAKFAYLRNLKHFHKHWLFSSISAAVFGASIKEVMEGGPVWMSVLVSSSWLYYMSSVASRGYEKRMGSTDHILGLHAYLSNLRGQKISSFDLGLINFDSLFHFLNLNDNVDKYLENDEEKQISYKNMKNIKLKLIEFYSKNSDSFAQAFIFRLLHANRYIQTDNQAKEYYELFSYNKDLWLRNITALESKIKENTIPNNFISLSSLQNLRQRIKQSSTLEAVTKKMSHSIGVRCELLFHF